MDPMSESGGLSLGTGDGTWPFLAPFFALRPLQPVFNLLAVIGSIASINFDSFTLAPHYPGTP
jgi:hypothetical protein